MTWWGVSTGYKRKTKKTLEKWKHLRKTVQIFIFLVILLNGFLRYHISVKISYFWVNCLFSWLLQVTQFFSTAWLSMGKVFIGRFRKRECCSFQKNAHSYYIQETQYRIFTEKFIFFGVLNFQCFDWGKLSSDININIYLILTCFLEIGRKMCRIWT